MSPMRELRPAATLEIMSALPHAVPLPDVAAVGG
jgi:hypothetical protein